MTCRNVESTSFCNFGANASNVHMATDPENDGTERVIDDSN